MNKELKEFGFNLEDIEESNKLIDNINEAINKMYQYTLKDRFEIILNNNLIECKEKLTNYRTIFGCRISYANLDQNISFIVREDNKPTYEELENIIKEVREYIKTKYDYLLVDDTFLDHDELVDRKQINHILQILEGSDRK